MHTFKGEHDTVFIYNSDLSGQVIIKKLWQGHEHMDEHAKVRAFIEIDGNDLLDFAISIIGMKLITWIEQIDRNLIRKLLRGEK